MFFKHAYISATAILTVAPRFQVLVLGAGYVSPPVIEYLVRDKSVGVTVAAALKEEADRLASR